MSAMGDGLNAGARTFTPGGPPDATAVEDPNRLASAMNDDSMLDEIEKELQASGQALPPGNSNYNNAGNNNQYHDLPPHADEFWFPECRNCTCCNGYKHGCQCCAREGMRQCKCAPAGGPPPPHVGPTCTPVPTVPPQQGGWMPAQPGPGTGQPQQGYGGGGGRGGGGGYQGRGRGGGRGRGPPPPCRFFNTPQGCRFGDTCRFSHGG